VTPWRAPVGDVRIGISGWRYRGWRRAFYPPGWPQARELEYAAQRVRSVEINGSFYSLQRPEHYAAWRSDTPPGFVFAVKGSRFITHMKRLAGVESALANFFASGVLRLGDKLGPLLWQLPPRLSFDPARLEAFFGLLPSDTRAAAALARRHDARVAGRAWTRGDALRPLRHALEVRHPSFLDRRFIDLLRRHRVALVVADTAGTWPFLEDVTADFVYVRLHGDTELYASGYTEPALAAWAAKIEAWARGSSPAGARLLGPAARPRRAGRDVFVYFDNDAKVHAPFDAMRLAARLGVGPEAATAVERPPGAPGEPLRTSWPAFRRAAPGSAAVREAHN
jgi:uncharacterized protein YecE (DUF72 family)